MFRKNLFLLCFSVTTLCLYEDQIEKFDWRQQFIGKAVYFALGQTTQLQDYLFIGSALHVLGAVDVNNKEIIWRQALEEDAYFLSHELCGNHILTVSKLNNTIIRIWDAQYGHIYLESPIYSESKFSALSCDKNNHRVFVVLNDRIITISLIQLKITSEDKLPSDLQQFNELVTFDNNQRSNTQQISLILSNKSSLAHVDIRISDFDDAPVEVFHHSFQKPSNSNISKCLLHGKESIVCLGQVDSNPTLFSTSLKMEKPIFNWSSTVIISVPTDILIIDSMNILITYRSEAGTGGGSIFTHATEGKYARKISIPNMELAIPFVHLNTTSLLVFEKDYKKHFNNMQVRKYNIQMGDQIFADFITLFTYSAHNGRLNSAAVLPDQKGILIFSEDHTIQCISIEGTQIWLREESLAHITSVEMIDLPVSAQQASMQEEFGKLDASIFELFTNRISSQMAQLTTAIRSTLDAWSFPKKQNNDDKVDPKANYQPLTRDSYNLHKIIVVVTSVGKIFGMDSDKGHILWDILVPDTEPLKYGKIEHLFQQRTTRHFPLRPISSVMLKSKISQLPILFSFDPISGMPLNHALKAVSKEDMSESIIHFDQHVLQVFLVPGPVSEKTNHIRPLGVIYEDLTVEMFPTGSVMPSRKSLLFSSTLTVYVVNEYDASITGYRVSLNQLNATNGQHYSAQRVWHMILCSNDTRHETILTSVKPFHEHTYSIGRVLGDRNVLYKYVNPNLLAVLTVGESIQEKTSVVSLYLIDVIVGQVIHSVVHRHHSSPVNLVVSENWVLYSVYNQRSLRTEINVLELFEPIHTMSSLVPSPWNLFLRSLVPVSWQHQLSAYLCRNQRHEEACLHSRVRTESTFSSRQRAINSAFGSDEPHESIDPGLLIPHIVPRSFILASPVRSGCISVTLTERGITAKDLLFGLEIGNLLELPKTLLDPRRTQEVTPELIEEGLEPYTPELPLSTFSIISYNKTLERMRRIITAPSGLESTSLIFVHGLDVFFTRTAPSKTYDLLRDDFDHWFIALVTVGMMVGAVVANRLAAQKELSRAWQ